MGDHFEEESDAEFLSRRLGNYLEALGDRLVEAIEKRSPPSYLETLNAMTPEQRVDAAKFLLEGTSSQVTNR